MKRKSKRIKKISINLAIGKQIQSKLNIFPVYFLRNVLIPWEYGYNGTKFANAPELF